MFISKLKCIVYLKFDVNYILVYNLTNKYNKKKIHVISYANINEFLLNLTILHLFPIRVPHHPLSLVLAFAEVCK